MRELEARCALEVYGHCKFVDCTRSAGRDPSEYVTDRAEEGANYIFGLEPRRR